MRPGVNLSISETPPSRTPSGDTGVWFITGLAEKGPTTSSQLITSISEYIRYFGSRVSYGRLYDVLDVFFREGGTQAYVTRIVGPAAVKAFVNLMDSVPAATLKAEALSFGSWGNSLNVTVTAGDAGGEFKLVVTDDVLGTLETSPSLVDKPAAIAWAANSDYIRLSDLAGTGDPAVGGPFSLATGADDQASITDTHWTNSLANFHRDLGPGQVSMPGRTTDVAWEACIAHAKNNNRVALLDGTDTIVKATILSAVQGIYSTDSKWAAMFGPWLLAPGVTTGTTRTVPPSPLVAGLIAKADAAAGTPNRPAAGDQGIATFCTELSAGQLTDADREELNAAGFNAIIMKFAAPRVYGWRSAVSPTLLPGWQNWANSRLVMEIIAEADTIGEAFIFDEIDGQGKTISAFGGALTGMLIPYYNIGSLYGATIDEAFLVDVGPSVNTPTTIENRELRATIMIRPSPFAEMITIELVKAAVTQ